MTRIDLHTDADLREFSRRMAISPKQSPCLMSLMYRPLMQTRSVPFDMKYIECPLSFSRTT